MSARRAAIAVIIIGVAAGGFYLGWRRPAAVKSIVAAPSAPRPLVFFDPPTMDLGRQIWGIELPFQTVLRNDGEKPITIDSTKKSCACTVETQDYKGRTLAPGESLPFDLTLQSRFQLGPRTEYFSVTFASGETAECNFAVDVVPTYRVEPEEIDFGAIELGDSGELSQVLTFKSEFDHQVVGQPEVNADWLQAAAAKRESSTEILVRALKNKLPPGASTANLVITTDDPVKPQVSIYVSAHGVQALSPDPQHVFLMGREAQHVRLLDPAGQAVVVVSAEPDDPAIGVMIAADGTIEVSNKSGAVIPQTITVRVKDQRERCARFLVSTF